jgi:DNA-binding LacI/PurR family transcriptional regulator
MDVAAQIRVDPALSATLAQQVREQLTWLISRGAVVAGDELPSVRSLAGSLGINYHTVRSAYRRLEADGLVETRPGRRSRIARFDPRHLWPPETAARTHLVGVVLPSLGPFYVELLEGAQDAARSAGVLLVVATTGDDQARALRSIAQLAAKGADGVVVVSHDISNLVAGGEAIAAGRVLPLVAVDRPGSVGLSVEADLDGAGYLAVRHLLEDGHREIGLVTLATPLSNVVPIEAGYRRALAEAGLPADERYLVRVGSWGLEAGAAAADGLLAGAARPTALVAISDLLAIGAMRRLRRAGLVTPGDVAVVGIDDSPLAALVDPSLTSVALPARAMGADAVAILQGAWGDAAPAPTRSVLGVRLTIRDSCGPHASRPRSSAQAETHGRS